MNAKLLVSKFFSPITILCLALSFSAVDAQAYVEVLTPEPAIPAYASCPCNPCAVRRCHVYRPRHHCRVYRHYSRPRCYHHRPYRWHTVVIHRPAGFYGECCDNSFLPEFGFTEVSLDMRTGDDVFADINNY